MHRVTRVLPLSVVAVASLLFVGCGSSDGGTTAESIFAAKCSTAGCHDSAGMSANFSMAAAGWEQALVGGKQKGGGIPNFMSVPECANMNYLDPGSNPATGLFMRKMTPQFGCGRMMPYIGSPITTSELATIQTWANGLTAAK
jgi:hypothetical protein